MAYLPIDLMTSERRAYRRLKTFNIDPAYVYGNQFRVNLGFFLSYESLGITIKIVSTVDFEFIQQSVTMILNGVKLKMYKGPLTESGDFDSVVNILPNNTQTTAEEITNQVTMAKGGSVSTYQQPVIDSIFCQSPETDPASAQTSMSGTRGFAAGTYYLKFEKLDSTAFQSRGTYDLIFNENP